MDDAKLILSLAVAALLLFMACTNNVAGGSSDTEVSASISGTVQDVSGTGIAGAQIRLRPVTYLPGTIPVRDSLGFHGYDGFADDNGAFRIDSLARGDYTLEVLSGDSAGVVMEIYVDTAETVRTVIEPLGMVSGKIDMYNHPDLFGKARIDIYGTEHSFVPDYDGRFSTRLPCGKYRMLMRADTAAVEDIILEFALKPLQLHDFGSIRMMTLSTPCTGYACDSSIVRTFLDNNGYAGTPVESVTVKKLGRIYKLLFRGMTITTPLSPLADLTAVEDIDFGNTGISDSCGFVVNMWNLETLILDSNEIAGISPVIGNFSSLRLLDISYNHLTALPEQMLRIKPFVLKLEGNGLCSVPETVNEWINRYDPGWHEKQMCQ